MQAGKLKMHYQPFRPAELIDNVFNEMTKIAKDKGLELSTQLDTALPYTLVGDISRLQQISVNLINNAIKFTEKGEVIFRTGRSGPKHWVLEVQDTGIGIPDEELSQIFDSFYQVDSSVTRKRGGFGLGLSIVEQLVTLMGGKVAVKSQVGQGSTFTVTLPIILKEEALYERK
jgi:signal transduction histidine kinase